jgi:hypothetical protein
MSTSVRLFVASLALLLAAAPALAQSDGNVMRERVVRPKAAPAPKRVTTPHPAGQQRKDSAVPQPPGAGSQNPGAKPADKPVPKDANKPAAAPAKTAEPAKKPASPSKAAAAQPPIMFYLATGEPDACGPGCREWIAAEGRIDAGAAGRFRALLGRLGGRKLPVYFHSPGGSVGDALEIGRIMRQRQMTAGAGWTIPDGCDRAQAREPACSRLKRSGRAVPAALDTSLAQCNSACVYTVLGATERRIAAGARLGVHSSHMTFRVRTSRPLTPQDRGRLDQMAQEKINAAYERLGRYIAEMGIDGGLLGAARRIPHERVRFLTRDEIAQFGIDRRRFVEDDWVVDERPAAKLTALKMIYQLRQNGWGYRLSFLRLACAGGADHIEVAYGQERSFSPTEMPRPITFSAGEDKFVLGTTNIYRTGATTERRELEIRRARVSVRFFEAAAGSGTIELKEGADQQDGESAPRIAKLSTVGLGRALRVLAARCGQPAEPAGASAAMPPPAGAGAAAPTVLTVSQPGPAEAAHGEADRGLSAPRSP